MSIPPCRIYSPYVFQQLLLLFSVLLLPLFNAAIVVIPASDSLAGKRLFIVHCSICHGPKGEGGKAPTLAVPKLFHAPTLPALVKVIKNGIPGTEMPATEFDESQIRQITKYLRQISQRPIKPVRGNPRNGEQLYRTRGNCNACHAIRGRGGALGPDLTDIGLRRGASYLRRSLTDPEADVPGSISAYRSDVSIPENFLQVRIRTKDGRDIVGVRVNEDTFSIQIRDFSNHVYSFFKSELLELEKDWGRSPMPSYRDAFSKKELDDLTAFLLSMRGEQ
jgi:putative heme-binding domain-containing protein